LDFHVSVVFLGILAKIELLVVEMERISKPIVHFLIKAPILAQR